MSKKAKAHKREKRLKQAKKRLEAKKKKRFAPLEEKVARQGLAQDMKVLYEPEGAVKMSEVLEEFVEPYVEETRNKEEHEKLLMIAIIAWNMALMPPEKRIEMLDKPLKKGIEPFPETIKPFIYELIERKERYFAQYTRQIVNFELTEQGNGYYLSVMSIL